jgi:RNA polymerase-binding transcription factor DksA
MNAKPEIRGQLLAQRRKLFAQVTHIEEDLLALTENIDPEMETEGQEENLNRLLDRLDERGKIEIESIDAALRRLADGTYGTCVDCGNAIPDSRLAAMLTAETCLGCAVQREKKRPAAG